MTADRPHAEEFRDLIDRSSLAIVERDDLARGVGKLLERGHQRLALLGLHEPLARVGCGIDRAGELVVVDDADATTPPLFGAHVLVRLVARELPQPRLKARRVAQLRQAPPTRNEDALGDVLARPHVADDGERDRAHHVAIRRDETRVGLRVPLGSGDDVCIDRERERGHRDPPAVPSRASICWNRNAGASSMMK